MALYAIGDVQGCFVQLQQLLQKIDFDPKTDQLWFTGDLVNRGSQSLETLRYIKGLGSSAVCVLGNHDLHLLAVSQQKTTLRKRDTLKGILEAPDRDELLDWLRHRPFFHYDESYCLLHAGLPPQWDLHQTKACAAEIEEILQGPKYDKFLEVMYGNKPDIWLESLSGWGRRRFITNCFTRLRYCEINGKLNFSQKSAPGEQPKHLLPWFEIPGRKSEGLQIIFGHWSSLGFWVRNGVYALDTGCVWGRQLSALRLDGEMYRTSVECTCC